MMQIQVPQFIKSYFLATQFEPERRWIVGMTRVFSWCAIAGFFIQTIALLFLAKYAVSAFALFTIGVMFFAIKLNDRGHTKAARLVRQFGALFCYVTIIASTGGLSSPYFFWAGVFVLGSMFSFGTASAVPLTVILIAVASYFFWQTGETLIYSQFVISLLFIYWLAYFFHRLSQYFINKSEHRATAIATILDNVRFGFLLVGRDLHVQVGFSKSCLDLLGDQLRPGVPFLEVLGLDKHRHSRLYQEFIEKAFTDELPEDITIGQLPAFVAIGSKIIGLSGALVRDKNQAVTKILFTLIDATDQQRAEKESRENKQLVRFLKDRDTFADFIEYARVSLQNCRVHCEQANHAGLRAELHTLKGNSALFDMVDVTQLIHDIEEKNTITLDELASIQFEFEQYLENNFEILQMRFDSQNEKTWNLSQKQLLDIEALVDQLGQSQKVSKLKQELQAIRNKPARLLLGTLPEHAQRLAENFNKELKVVIRGGDLMLDPHLMKPIIQSLVHIVRNAIDHGLEVPAERGHKPPVGQLLLEFSETLDAWVIVIADDGRGIDQQKVADRAQAQGLVSAEALAKMSEQQICRLILLDGLSTAKVANEISGRGIGLAAVEAAVLRAGGQMDIQSQPGVGTGFTLTIPKNHRLDGERLDIKASA